MKRKRVFFLLLSLCLLPVLAQVTKTDVVTDKQKVRSYFDSVNSTDNTPGKLVVKAALSLLNTPYVGQTLEGNATEQLVVNLRELDCLTLVENSLALSRAAQVPHPDFQVFTQQLQNIRYRNGRIDGYTSRLHYTTDWITDNVAQGIVEDKTRAIGGKQFTPNVHFMSTHPASYAALKNNPQEVAKIRKIEQTINLRTSSYCSIPKAEIAKRQSQIQSGDIICFTTNLSGLDISHVAIAYWKDGKLTFIHASSSYKKVMVQPGTLVDYCKAIKSNTGIMVLRPSIFKKDTNNL